MKDAQGQGGPGHQAWPAHTGAHTRPGSLPTVWRCRVRLAHGCPPSRWRVSPLPLSDSLTTPGRLSVALSKNPEHRIATSLPNSSCSREASFSSREPPPHSPTKSGPAPRETDRLPRCRRAHESFRAATASWRWTEQLTRAGWEPHGSPWPGPIRTELQDKEKQV